MHAPAHASPCAQRPPCVPTRPAHRCTRPCVRYALTTRPPAYWQTMRPLTRPHHARARIRARARVCARIGAHRCTRTDTRTYGARKPARLLAHGQKTRLPIDARAQKNPLNGGLGLWLHVPKIKNKRETDSARHYQAFKKCTEKFSHVAPFSE